MPFEITKSDGKIEDVKISSSIEGDPILEEQIRISLSSIVDDLKNLKSDVSGSLNDELNGKNDSEINIEEIHINEMLKYYGEKSTDGVSLDKELNPGFIFALQTKLVLLGFFEGEVDALDTSSFRKAVSYYKVGAGFDFTGEVTKPFIDSLLSEPLFDDPLFPKEKIEESSSLNEEYHIVEVGGKKIRVKGKGPSKKMINEDEDKILIEKNEEETSKAGYEIIEIGGRKIRVKSKIKKEATKKLREVTSLPIINQEITIDSSPPNLEMEVDYLSISFNSLEEIFNFSSEYKSIENIKELLKQDGFVKTAVMLQGIEGFLDKKTTFDVIKKYGEFKNEVMNEINENLTHEDDLSFKLKLMALPSNMDKITDFKTRAVLYTLFKKYQDKVSYAGEKHGEDGHINTISFNGFLKQGTEDKIMMDCDIMTYTAMDICNEYGIKLDPHHTIYDKFYTVKDSNGMDRIYQLAHINGVIGGKEGSLIEWTNFKDMGLIHSKIEGELHTNATKSLTEFMTQYFDSYDQDYSKNTSINDYIAYLKRSRFMHELSPEQSSGSTLFMNLQTSITKHNVKFVETNDPASIVFDDLKFMGETLFSLRDSSVKNNVFKENLRTDFANLLNTVESFDTLTLDEMTELRNYIK